MYEVILYTETEHMLGSVLKLITSGAVTRCTPNQWQCYCFVETNVKGVVSYPPITSPLNTPEQPLKHSPIVRKP